ncbi:hypothetical protein [Candidatus Mycoplasma haematohominis]|uniref:hypothetical protein n=1 Tax=Candidatus Mycoplasma haematohominis TaxID=1494318 RepID=UPI001C0A68D7|nr:hypothetical protein [Candidatus Mycoplasma haemohominis]
MSTQAIAGAAAGAALLGGGGTLAAYATGAFNKDDYFNKAKRELTDKEYIADQEDNMKKWLIQKDKGNDYKKNLKDNISNMTGVVGSTAPESTKVDKLQGDTPPTEQEAKEIYDYTKAWCESKKNAVYNDADGQNKQEFERFKKVCFVTKIAV